MAEEKILIPAYKRAGSCERCGADVYAPAVEVSGGWPLMSACACKQGPAFLRPARAKDSERRAEVKREEQARAA